VLGVGPDQQQPTSIHYAAGRDLRLAARSRSFEANVQWLGVPWQGRTPGQAIAAESLQATTLSMLRLAFGIRGGLPAIQEPGSSQNLSLLEDAAWDAGILALPGAAERWTTAELRQHLQRGQPVVVFVGKHSLPGHPMDEGEGEQPLLMIGTTDTGFIYADPSFSSSLGYGIELSNTDLEKLWDGAAQPRQALAFTARPGVMSAHVAVAVAPVPITRIQLPSTPTPLPTAVAVAVPTPTQVATVEPLPTPLAAAREVAHTATETETPWGALAVGVVVGGVSGLVLALRRLRSGRWL
jgi:hypothetical protein